MRLDRRVRRGLGAAWLVAWLAAVDAAAMETVAKHAFIIDAGTGTVLLEKDADAPVPPASLGKLMTVYLVFERLAAGRLSLDDEFLVSKKAWRKGGSKMFVQVDTRVRVEDLLRGIIVQSGNDACIVVAEGLSGSEERFAEEMNRRAEEMGLSQSHFRNATGWPDPRHVMSARDVAILSQRLIEDFPDRYRYFAEKSFTYGKIKQPNRNPLLYHDVGADGLKTGYTAASGYGLAASASRDGRRIVVVLQGMKSAGRRAAEALRLVEWAFRSFDNYLLFEKGATVEAADVWLGAASRVPLTIGRDLAVTLTKKARRGMKAKLVYTGPVPAPIAKGDSFARLVVTAPGLPAIDVPLYAGADVSRLGLFGRIGAAVRHMLWGASG